MAFPGRRPGDRASGCEVRDFACNPAGTDIAQFASSATGWEGGVDEGVSGGRCRKGGGGGVRALVPWTGMNVFKDEMDRLLDRLFEPRLCAFEALGEWTPKLDLSETKDAYVARLEVPGVGPKEVNVSIREGLLMITGEKAREDEEKDAKHHRVERAWGRFARTIPVPGPVDTGRTTATFKEGALTVTLPKTAVARESFVPVKAGWDARSGAARW